MFTLILFKSCIANRQFIHLTCFRDNGEEKKPENLRPSLHKEVSVLNTAFRVTAFKVN